MRYVLLVAAFIVGGIGWGTMPIVVVRSTAARRGPPPWLAAVGTLAALLSVLLLSLSGAEGDYLLLLLASWGVVFVGVLCVAWWLLVHRRRHNGAQGERLDFDRRTGPFLQVRDTSGRIGTGRGTAVASATGQTIKNENPFRYAGYLYDGATGLY